MKLDEIPKKNLLNAPEGYFDKLPGIVQSRIEGDKRESQSQLYFRFTLRYALPVLALVAAGIFWFRAENRIEFESELAAIDVEDLEFYIEVSDMHAGELTETEDPIAIAWTPEELDELENNIYASYGLSDTDVRGLLNDLEVESVNDSVQ